MSRRSLKVATVDFFGYPNVAAVGDFTGFMFGPGGLSGIRSSGTSGEPAQRPGQHGEFDEQVFLTGQVVGVQGKAIARSDAALDQLGDVLGGLGATGGVVDLAHTDNGRTLWGRGRVLSHAFDQERGGIPRADYVLQIRKPDPLWYGVPHVSTSVAGASAATVNRGNFPALGWFVVRGPQPGGYRINIDGGAWFSVTGTLAAGSTDVVDFRDGTVRRNGELLLGAVMNTDMRAVPGGGSPTWRCQSIDAGAAGDTDLHLPPAFSL